MCSLLKKKHNVIFNSALNFNFLKVNILIKKTNNKNQNASMQDVYTKIDFHFLSQADTLSVCHLDQSLDLKSNFFSHFQPTLNIWRRSTQNGIYLQLYCAGILNENNLVKWRMHVNKICNNRKPKGLTNWNHALKTAW